ncbi:LOW QUALITY PROTEIN: cytochrome P450 6A1-like [Lucilia sericata]|uniref:LOW QUALITY PROTEIN: cytochrome P450 6A1-like n=1 Tax=Lucilia sericata TaxID=13632 RepID=UPI0018A867F1|nr:LOW QUALITY PROTEIN: cytochrome P450 6A1-like [Lucilia sericata]
MEAISLSLFYPIIAVVTAALYFIKRNLNYWKDQGIPTEKPHFLWGNIKGLRTHYHIGDIAANYYKKFKGSGPFAGLLFIQRPAVVLLDKNLIKNVLIKDFNNFIDRGLYYNEKTDPLSGHLFLIDSQKWKILRNKLSPTFTSGKMKLMYPTLLKVTDQFISVMKDKVKEDPIVDIHDMLNRFTIDIISSCAFGIECNSLGNSNSEFPRVGKIAIMEQRHNTVIMALIDSFPHVARKLGMRIFPEEVHQFFMTTVRDTITYREKHNIQRNDFLNILLEMKKNENDKTGLEGLSIEEICAQVFVFFLGGFETSSSTMTYALYELAQHQHLQERLRQEINEVFENSPDGQITYENLKNMNYLHQVVSETQRKHPVIAQLHRQALKDYVVPGFPQYVIKKDTPILISVLGLHHDPELYPQPEEFDPERFTPEMVKQRDPVEYLPFGDGPRNCIGKRFGQMQTRLGLAYLIRNFQFSICSQTEMPIIIDPKAMAYVPKNVIYLKLEEISSL